MKKRRILLGLALAASAVFTLASCGDDTKPSQQSEPAQEVVNEKFTVKFMNGSTEVKSEELDGGATIVAPADPTKASTEQYRYVFAGWFTAEVGGTQVTDFGKADSNKTFYAHFTEVAIKYNVVFMNGDTIVDQKEVAYGASIVAPSTNPTKDEDDSATYDFDGWYTAATGGTKVTEFGTVTGQVTYYARFTSTTKEYTIAFMDGEDTVSSAALAYGQTITAPNQPERTDTNELFYVFDGWFTANEGGELVTDFGTVTGAKTFYARFHTIERYSVTFKVDGETFQTVYTNKDKKAVLETSPTKSGMVFDHWELNGVAFDLNTEITGNIVLNAVFEEIKEYENVGFGGSYTSWATLFANSTETDSKGRKILDSDATSNITMNGMTFKGKALLDANILNTNASEIVVNLPDNKSSINMSASWGSTNNVGVIKVYYNGNVIYTSTETYSKDNASITLALDNLSAGSYTIKAEKTDAEGQAGMKVSTIYYSRAVKYVNVNYVLNNGETKSSDSIKAGNKLQSLPNLVYSGHEFDGWYTTATFDAGSEFDINTEINSEITLYAKWHELTADELALVTFTTNLADVTFSSLEVKKGTKLTELPTKDVLGYRLAGWYTTQTFDAGSEFNINNAITDNIELFAKYVKTYDVTFLNKDGGLIKTVTVDEGEKVTETVKAPYIAGYVFDHWVVDGTSDIFEISEDAISTNLTVKAYYKEDTNPVAKVSISTATGIQEAAIVEFAKYTDADSYMVLLSGNGETDKELDSKNVYLSTNGNKVRADIIGIKAGDYEVRIVPVIDGSDVMAASEVANIKVSAYDRSGYAHFNNAEGVGAYNDDGTLKDNAIVIYVTDANKNTVELSYGGITVTGIGNILNSVGQACGEAGHETECKKVSNGKTYYGKGNTNQGILLKLAEDNIPLVVRFVGCVSDSGLYAPGTFAAASASKIEGLTAYDSVDCGGSEGDNGHMARMKSAKNLTLEGVGDEATIDGWGFHLICETAHTDLAKNFEVRNLRFINTPEDAIGMEGQETESTLTITASVERCWVHHNTFVSPSISGPAESDKSEGDGSCDFKRGRYFTCSYNYFENCHKTNLVGSSKTSVQYNMSYHHNIWYNCAARQPLARRGNIHFYNNLIIGTTDTVSSLRADAYMFAEGNYYMGCSRPVEYKAEGSAGVCKAYNNNLVGCYNNFDATVVTDRETEVSSNCKDNGTNTSYANFDTNSELFYYDSQNKKSDCYLTDANQARLDCLAQSGSRYRTALDSQVLKVSTDVTTQASSATISGATSLTIAKGKGVLKVFTVTAPVTLTIAAESSAGFDTGYLLKLNGELVSTLSASAKTIVLENGVYVITSSVSFSGANGKNDKETTVTTCDFAPYDSAELNQKLIDNYNAAVDQIPTTITYDDTTYYAIKNAMDLYQSLGKLQSEVSYTTVLNAYNAYKNAGVLAVEELISAIGTVNQNSGSAITAARNAYNKLLNRCSDATISNYNTLVSAESAYESYAVEGCIAAINQIGTVTLDSENLIITAEGIYASLNEDQQKQVTNYQTLVNARSEYDDLLAVKTVDDLLLSANGLENFERAEAAYLALSDTLKAKVNQTSLALMYRNYTIALIDSLPETVTRANADTVAKARALYDALSSDNKELVTNYSKLVAAEAALNELPSTQVTKTLTATDFNMTGATTFSGNVWTGLTITGVSKTSYSQATKVVLNATRGDKTVFFSVYYSTDGQNWTLAGKSQPGSNNSAADLEYTINSTEDVYIKIEITCTKTSEGTAKLGAVNSIKVTCYE